MSSENILLNSPALHSLKRTQLTTLCRRHGLKANGKNEELVTRLQAYARDMPPAGSVATFDADNDGGMMESRPDGSNDEMSDGEDVKHAPPSRPSEAWSMMDDLVREDGTFRPNSSANGLAAIGEFGTGASIPKSSSVSSSIKAIATSIIRGGSSKSKASAVKHQQPTTYDTTPPEGDVDSFAPEDEVSDHEFDPNTSISTMFQEDANSGAPRSTVRLISSSSQAAIPPSPEYANPPPFVPPMSPTLSPNFNLSPPSPGDHDSLYPDVPLLSQMPGVFPTPPMSFTFSPRPSSAAPFTFGTAAADERKAAVLEEMNRRMGLASGEPGAIDFSALAGISKKRERGDEEDEDRKSSNTGRFSSVHQKQFDKMPSIADHYAARRASPRKSKLSTGGVKGRSSLAASSKTRRKSITAIRARQVSGTISTAPLGGERPTKRARTSAATFEPLATATGAIAVEQKHISIAEEPTASQKLKASEDAAKVVVTVTNTAKKKVDAAKARRKSRSSMARQSMGKSGVLGGASSKPKSKGLGGKFGFLKSSAKLARNVYQSVVGNNGAGPTPAANTSIKGKSAIPTASSPLPIPSVSSTHRTLPGAFPAPTNSSPFGAQPKQEDKKFEGGRSLLAKNANHSKPTGDASTSQSASIRTMMPPPASRIRKPSGPVTALVNGTPGQSSSRSSRSRSPLPPWDSGTGTGRSNASSSRQGSIIGSNASKASAATAKGSATTSSFGFKRPSTLLAPTASSRAKMQSNIRPPGATSVSVARQSSTGIGAKVVAGTPIPTTNKFGFKSPTAVTQSPQLGFTPAQFSVPGPSATKATPNRFGFANTSNTAPVTPTPTFKFATTAVTSPTETSRIPHNFAFSRSPAPITQGTPALETITNVKPQTPTASTSLSKTSEVANSIEDTGVAEDGTASPAKKTGSTGSRRPRISRSKVIARLGEKRAAADALARASPARARGSAATPGRSPHKMRSSLAVHALARRSLGAGLGGAGGGSPREKAVLESFNRGYRKSEVARRRSRFGAAGPSMTSSPRLVGSGEGDVSMGD